jgi:hypothetical protein
VLEFCLVSQGGLLFTPPKRCNFSINRTNPLSPRTGYSLEDLVFQIQQTDVSLPHVGSTLFFLDQRAHVADSTMLSVATCERILTGFANFVLSRCGREMLRIKRSVAASFSQIHYNTTIVEAATTAAPGAHLAPICVNIFKAL